MGSSDRCESRLSHPEPFGVRHGRYPLDLCRPGHPRRPPGGWIDPGSSSWRRHRLREIVLCRVEPILDGLRSGAVHTGVSNPAGRSRRSSSRRGERLQGECPGRGQLPRRACPRPRQGPTERRPDRRCPGTVSRCLDRLVRHTGHPPRSQDSCGRRLRRGPWDDHTTARSGAPAVKGLRDAADPAREPGSPGDRAGA